MKSKNRRFAGSPLARIRRLWSNKRDLEFRRNLQSALRFESLENRVLLAADLGADQDELIGPLDPAALITSTGAGSGSADQAEGESPAEGEDAPDLVAFAKALTDAGVIFYGADWCPHCNSQKAQFEDGARFLPFVEVTNPDHSLNQIGQQENITAFPTWDFNGNRVEGELTLQQISNLSGVAIPNSSEPTFAPIEDFSFFANSAFHLAVDGYDPNGNPLTYTVTSSNPNVTAQVLQGNQSWRLTIQNRGAMTFQFFDGDVPNTTNRIKTLTNNDFYDNLILHRIIQGFVAQGGDPNGNGTGGSTLPNLVNEFNASLQHNNTGLLSFANAGDNTNNSQFFITQLDNNLRPDSEQILRRLDFNHPIFGAMTEGGDIFAGIQRVPVGANDKPLSNLVIESAEVFTDTENAMIRLNAPEGFTGSTVLTITASDNEGNTFSQQVNVSVAPDPFDGSPFLNNLAPLSTPVNTPLTFNLDAEDVEGDTIVYSATNNSGVNYTFNINSSTGQVTVTPPNNFVGVLELDVAVRQSTNADANDQFDRRTLEIQVTPPAPTAVDLLPAFDSGASDTDNITNETTLQFQVTGVQSGAVVQLLVNGSAIAQGTATSSSITLQSSAFDSLGDGVHNVEAVQIVNQAVSAPVSLSVTIDTTAPGAFTSTAPTEAQVGQELNYDAQNPGEGTAGFSYSLVNAPAGAAIDPATGVFTWTPAAGQIGQQSFGIQATDAAGNSISQAVSVNVAGQPLVSMRLQVTDLDDNPITSILVGQDFKLRAFVEDLRDQNPQGVFAAFLDIEMTGNLVSVKEPNNLLNPSNWGPRFQVPFAGSVPNANLIDELGAFSASITPPGAGEFLLFSIVMTANGAGTATFVGDPADEAPSHNTLLFGRQAAVPGNEILFTDATLVINSTDGVNDDVFNFDEDSTNNNMDVLTNDTPPAGGEYTITSVSATSDGGVVTIAGDGKSLQYSPADDFFGVETFTYTVNDGLGGTETATVTVQVVNTNDPPTGVNDAFTVNRGSTSNFLDVLANDQIAPDENETLRVTAIGARSNGGAATIGTAGTHIRYTPQAGFTGTDTFTYTLTDGNGGTATATVTVTVTGSTEDPNAVNDTFTVAEDSTSTVLNVLNNDTLGSQGTALTITSVGNFNRGGAATITNNGTRISYTPAANFNGTETFTYTVSNGAGGADTATVTVTVSSVNDPPNAVNDTATVQPGSGANTINVLANDQIAPDTGETLTVTAVTQGANGAVAIASGGTGVTYTPNAGFTGTDTFTYTISDGNGGTDTATVTVSVTDVDPSNLSGFVYIDANGNGVRNTGEVGVANVLVTLQGTPIGGSAITRTARTAADGSYSFANVAPGQYTITQTQPAFLVDGGETIGSLGGTISANDRFSLTLGQDQTGTGYNFAELGRPTGMISIVQMLASRHRGSILAQSSSGEDWYIFESGWNGFSSAVVDVSSNLSEVTLTVRNPNNQLVRTVIPTSSSMQVRILNSSNGSHLVHIFGSSSDFTFTPVQGINPTVANDTATVNEDTSNNVINVLANDTPGTAGEALTVTAVGAASNGGTVTIGTNGQNVRYTPAANFFGTETFTYTASGANGGSATGTVTVTVNNVNDPPTAVNDTATVAEDSTNNTIHVLANDSIAPDTGETLTISGLGTASNGGTVTVGSNNQSVVYTPAANFFGTETFTYTISDGNGGTATATVTVTVTNVNDPPTANDDAATVDVNSTNNPLDVLVNDSIAPDTNETLTITSVGATSAGGTVTIAANNLSLIYTPAANFEGTETFTYTISDGNGGTDTATVTVTVDDINSDPVAVDDTATVDEDSTNNEINVLANDHSGPDTGETLSITDVGEPNSGGAVAIGTGGNVVYTPAANFFGTETFTYTISDGNGGTATATVTVTVNNVNDDPTAVNDAITVDLNSTNNTLDVLANDTDAPDAGETLIITAVGQTSNGGAVSIAGDGMSLIYTPAANFTGTETFTYTISDGNGGTDTATVTVTVDDINSDPTAVDDTATVDEDSVDNTIDVLANDTIAPDVGETLTITAVGATSNGGTVVIANDNLSVVYTPAADFFGTETFTYTISDGNGGSATATVTVTVTGVNDNPTADDDSFTVQLDSSGNMLDVLTNDSFAPDVGETLTITGVGAASNGGTAVIANDNLSIVYTPASGFSGTETFTYTISDGNGGTDTATVTVLVNNPPTATDDMATVDEDSVDVVLDVLVNDSATPDSGETLVIDAVGTPDSGGSVVIGTGGANLVYTPAANFFGTETFTYTINDGNGGSAEATVTVIVENVNDDPAATDDAFTVDVDSSGNTLDVLANDSFLPDAGETLTVTAVGQTSNGGTVSIAGDSMSLIYTPPASFTGTDTFTYTISDGNGGTDTATVTVTVDDINSDPTAIDDTATVDEDSVDNTIDVLANDTFAPDVGETLTITAVGAASNGGTVVIANDNLSIVYTPAADFFGTETFTYTISDGNGGSATATVTVTVTGANDDPTAVDDSFTVQLDSSGNTLNVLANDSDAPDAGETLTITSVGETSGEGVVTIAGDNLSLVYTPASGFSGTETFTYTIDDGNGGSAQATVTVLVNSPPTAVDDEITVNEDSIDNTIDVLANDTFAPDSGEVLMIFDVGTPDNGGTVAIAGDGLSLIYSPAADFVGTETIVYAISDGNGGTAQATVTVTVTNVNDDPTAVDDAATVDEDSVDNTIDVLANDTFAPDVGETLTITAVGAASNGGSASIANDNLSIVYTPAADFFGTETFTYTVEDGNGGSATATVTVTVTGANDDPTAADDSFTVQLDSSGNTLNVLANDSDAPDTGETLTISVVGAPDNGGDVQIAGNNLSLIFTPASGFSGTETFTYTIDDGNGGSAQATVTVLVNSPPTAVDDEITVNEDSIDNTLDVLANDTFAPDSGEVLMIFDVGTPDNGGTVAIAGDGLSLIYSPAADFVGTETIVYAISDGNGGTAQATVTVTVTAAEPEGEAPEGESTSQRSAVDAALAGDDEFLLSLVQLLASSRQDDNYDAAADSVFDGDLWQM